MRTAPETIRSQLLAYLSRDERTLVDEAYHLAAIAHAGQYRADGTPYITHPVAVATIMAEWRMDSQSVAASLVHDVLEDTLVKPEDLEILLGRDVLTMVKVLTKPKTLSGDLSLEEKRAHLNRVLTAGSKDKRILLIKLADRLHNMRTIEHLSAEQKRRISKESLSVFVPISYRFGLVAIGRELEILAHQNISPRLP